jgi:pimeloyl-ACP methyl ester carboxylesterase
MTRSAAAATNPYIRGGRVSSVDGTSISYLAPGSGPVVVCLHGGLGTALSLVPLSDHLADEFELVCINLRGHGSSEWGHAAPSIDRHVEDVLAVIDAVGPIGAVFGYSFDAVVALETALAAPGHVKKLAIYEPPLPITYPIPDISWIKRAVTQGDYEVLVLQAAAQGGAGLSPTELAAIREDPLWLSKVAHAPTLAPTMAVLAGLPATVEQYEAVTVPTKLISGTASAPFLAKAADLLAAVLPEVTREHLDGQGHHVDHALLAERLRAFLRARTASAP